MIDKMAPLSPGLVISADVPGLAPEDRALVTQLLEVLRVKSVRNTKRNQYYAGKNVLHDLGISIPPQLRMVETVVGWPAKAVDMLASRSIFDGYTFRDGSTSLALEEMLDANQFRNLYREAITSELINSCAFLTVSAGGVGEPGVLINAYPATQAAATWDARKKRIKAGLVVAENTIDHGVMYLYTDTYVAEIETWSSGKGGVAYFPHRLGRPLIEPLRYSPTLTRPFGKSRISRAVMSITDSAVRAALRTEVAAEFFTTPQRYLLGVDEDLPESMVQWESYMDRIFAISTNKEGQTPQYGQLAQMSMQPHIDYIRSLAARFAGETGIPVSSLGVIHDNPASAEAIYAAKEDLTIEADIVNATNGESLRNLALMVLAMTENKPIAGLSDVQRSVMPRFRNPAMPSVVSQADAMCKMISALPWLADSDVALEEFGFSDDQIRRLQSDRRQAQARERLTALMMNGGQPIEG